MKRSELKEHIRKEIKYILISEGIFGSIGSLGSNLNSDFSQKDIKTPEEIRKEVDKAFEPTGYYHSKIDTEDESEYKQTAIDVISKVFNDRDTKDIQNKLAFDKNIVDRTELTKILKLANITSVDIQKIIDLSKKYINATLKLTDASQGLLPIIKQYLPYLKSNETTEPGVVEPQEQLSLTAIQGKIRRAFLDSETKTVAEYIPGSLSLRKMDNYKLNQILDGDYLTSEEYNVLINLSKKYYNSKLSKTGDHLIYSVIYTYLPKLQAPKKKLKTEGILLEGRGLISKMLDSLAKAVKEKKLDMLEKHLEDVDPGLAQRVKTVNQAADNLLLYLRKGEHLPWKEYDKIMTTLNRK